MAEIGGFGCGCRRVSGGNFFHPGRFSLKSCFLEQRTRSNRNFFRNVSLFPPLKRGRLITNWSSVTGNKRIMNVPIIDPLQGDFPEVIEEFFEHGVIKCVAFNHRGSLLAAGCADDGCLRRLI